MKFKSKILIISLVVIVALTLGVVSAADNASDVQTTLEQNTSAVSGGDAVDDDFVGVDNQKEILSEERQFNGDTFTGLQSQINNARSGDTIVLNKDILQDGNSQILINKALTINGNGHTIDAAGKSRIFSISADNVVLKNIVFINGNPVDDKSTWDRGDNTIYGACGGAIKWNGDKGEIENCYFINNTVTPKNNTAQSYGGTIFWNSSNAKLINCNFMDNLGVYRGGVVYLFGQNFTVSHCNFLNNTPLNLSSSNGGGALEAIGTANITGFKLSSGVNCTVLNCTFKNNYGGWNTLAMWGGHEYVYDCTFINNTGLWGGAIYVDANKYIYPTDTDSRYGPGVVCNCTFINNTSPNVSEDGWGGGINVQAPNSLIKDCIFINNSGHNAGALNLGASARNTTVDNCTFINNNGHVGGALRAVSTSPSTIKNCVFTNNTNYEIYLWKFEFYLENNTISNFINNNGGIIKSHVKITVLNNSTVYGKIKRGTRLTLKITDDNNNPISSTEVNFFINGAAKAATRDSKTGEMYLDYTTTIADTYPVSATSTKFTNYTVYRGTLVVEDGGDFTILKNLIDGATAGTVINLTRDYIYTEGMDTMTTGIAINKNLTINGNGHTIDAAGKSGIFSISNAKVTLNDINFVNGKNYPLSLTNSNVTISNCNFKNPISSYDIYSTGGNLYLDNNTLTKAIYLSKTKVLSKTTITVLENSTILCGVNRSSQITATVKDDNNNTILGNNLLTFILNNGTEFNATGYYSLPDYVYGYYTFTKRGFYTVSVSNSEYLKNRVVYKGSVNVMVTDFMLLQQLIDNAAPGSTINLTRNYTFIPNVDWHLDIQKSLTINGNGYTINGADNTDRLFYVVGDNVTLKNFTVINSGGAIVFGPSNNCSIIDCKFKNCTVYSDYVVLFGYNCVNARVINCEFTNTKSQYASQIPYEIRIGFGATVYLQNNKLSTMVYVENGKILSETKIIILDNSTVYVPKNNSTKITAVVNDDNNNTVWASGLISGFVLENGTVITPSWDSNTGIWSGQYTFKDYGYYVISANYANAKLPNSTLFKGTIGIKENTTLKIEYNDNITTLDDLFIIAYVTDAATGDVIFTVGNESYTRTVADGLVVFVLKKHLSVGEYNLTVKYAGDVTYKSMVESGVLNVRLATTPVIRVFGDGEINVGSSVVLNASANYHVDADFYFIILKDNVEITRIRATETGGIYSAEYVFTSKGNYQISASYGDVKDLVVNNATVSVNMPCVIDVNVSDVTCGSDVILNITVPINATGVIGIQINNNVTYVPLPAGHEANILYNLGKLPVSDYTVVVGYVSDNNYNPAAAYASFKVGKIDAQIIISNPLNPVVGTPVTISFTTNSNSTYTLKLNGEAIANNTSYTPLKEGVYVITVEMDANDWFNDGFNMTTFTVSPKPVPVDPKMNLTYDANPKLGDNIAVFVTLPSDVNGTVTLLINNKTNATFNVVNGKANVTVKGVSDKNTYTVYYAGSDKYLESTKSLDLNVVLPTTLIAPAVTCIYNDDAYLVITLKDVYGNALKNTVISVNLNGARNLTTDANGQAKVSLLNMAPNTYNAVINFAGTSKYLKTNATAKVIINKATPKLTAKNKKFKKKLKTKKYSVTLKTNKNKPLAKVKVTLKIKKKTYKATTNAKGKATFKIKKLAKKGKYKSTVTFAGNAYYNKASKKVTITVK